MPALASGRVFFLALLLLALLALPAALFADEGEGEDPDRPAPPVEDAPRDLPAAAPADPAPEPPAKEPESTEPTLHKVYVPYRDLSKVFEKEGEGVFLPYEEFLDLWRRAHGPESRRARARP